MIFRAIIAIFLGLLATVIVGLVAPHSIAVLIGVLVGLLYFFGYGGMRLP